jgi:transcription initiation factor IIF auxiliary subunit
MAGNWTLIKAGALKLLGKKGKLPKPRVDLDTVLAAEEKAWTTLTKAREEMEKQIVEYETSIDKVKNAAKQYADIIDGDDFGLDKNSPDDKKTIAQVQKLLDEKLQHTVENVDKMKDRLDKLDKFLTDFSRLDAVSA